MKEKTGRPSLYNDEVVNKICLAISTTSKGLKTILEEDESLPCISTVFNWLNDESKKDFLDKYTRARESQADVLADEIIAIADDSSKDELRTKQVKNADGSTMNLIEENKEFTNRSKLRVEARKWVASKLKPKKYADRLDIDQKIEGTIKLTATFNDEEEKKDNQAGS